MKFYTEQSLDKLQEEINLEKVCEALNMDESTEVKRYECPFCEEESLILNDSDKPTLYYCFDCQAKGDAISLIMNGWEQSFNDAVNFLSIMFNCKMEESELKQTAKDDCDTEEELKVKIEHGEKLAMFAKALGLIKENEKDD